ncbi:response regulator receiver modulated metal dependent phosphohydrolase [Caballeronia arvi]|uniref:Response regulator receiver modulated metal dependent phosphohydrolase n=1 Tax=Caballeronia arvi TaxID=1777135 RepID=A0A158L5U4_9BURK|nr:response regulator [Caballeronia arvi]SAL88688.1 response regulator receiver modulated metal dependent phosphohydrolase [Caballeronia arvi]
MHSVLLVDDDFDSLSALRFVFEVHDFQVFGAEHGGVALAQLAKHLPDLVVTDMEMPQFDGIELCKRLKCYPTFASLPVILVSGGQPPANVPMVWDAFLPKPVDFYQLIAVIEQLPVFRLGSRRE